MNRTSHNRYTHSTTRTPSRPSHTKGWEHVARWYDGMVGDRGNDTHQAVGLKTVIAMLSIHKGDCILDVGCGQGVLAPVIHSHGGTYTGLDASRTLIEQAQIRHAKQGTFFVGDAARLSTHRIQKHAPFDACVFLLSIQDMPDAEKAIRECSASLKSGGKMVLFMNHPAFRIPRQSGWGYDRKRKLVYRRVDSYLSSLDVPMRTHYTTHKTLTRSYHRPVAYYINALANAQIAVTQFEEIPYIQRDSTYDEKATLHAQKEIPHFLAILGIKTSTVR
jgi:ubiquinone/menaquinone biosynthesis C-methylase UbiE